MVTGNAPRTPVSIVCVFNDPEVLESCLQRSISMGLAEAPDTEFIPVDNRSQTFSTAGAALNHGAREARHDVVVFVHQDVVLHSLEFLEQAAAVLLADSRIGVMGAVGIDSRRRIIGRIRDRVVNIGDEASQPRDIDSLDEVLFLVPREQVLAEPVTEDPILAWHAYGVEYVARMRRAGKRAVVHDVPITHNSLTINLDRLDEAHHHVGRTYLELLPLHTTCGTIYRTDGPGALLRTLRRARGARIWWGESWEARALTRRTGADVVIADIRLVIDDALTLGGFTSLRVLDVTRPGDLSESVAGLMRFGHPYSVQSVGVARARAAIAERRSDELLLVTSLERDEVAQLGLDGNPFVIGHSRDTGIWVIVGANAGTLEPLWSARRNRPFAGLLPRRGTRDGVRRSLRMR